MSTDAIGPGAGGFEVIDAKEIIRLKVEPNDEGGHTVHTRVSATGTEMVAGVGVMLADWIHGVCQEVPADPAVELGGMLAAIQDQAFRSLAAKKEAR